MELNIKEFVKEAIEKFDIRCIVREEIKALIQQEALSEIRKTVVEQANKLITTEIDRCLNGKIKTDDGWGKKFEYDSFADLFKKTLREKLDNSWDVKRNIEDIIKDRVTKLLKQEENVVANAIANGVLAKLPEQKG